MVNSWKGQKEEKKYKFNGLVFLLRTLNVNRSEGSCELTNLLESY